MRLPERGQHVAASQPELGTRLVTGWHASRLGMLWLAAVVPPFVYALFQQPVVVIGNFMIAALTLQCWHSVFRRKEGDRSLFLTTQDLLQAVLFVLLLPTNSSLWQIVLTISFGTVFGDRLFGGRGFAFLNTVVVGMSFYLYSFNLQLEDVVISAMPIVLLAPATTGLLLFELVSLHTVIGICIGAVLFLGLSGIAALLPVASSSAVLLVTLFLGADPAAGGSTNTARCGHGLLLGMLLGVLTGLSTNLLSAAIFATLIASLSAPFIDYAVIRFYTHRRQRRHA